MKIIAVAHCDECPFATNLAALTDKETMWCIHGERPEPKKLEGSVMDVPDDCPLEDDASLPSAVTEELIVNFVDDRGRYWSMPLSAVFALAHLDLSPTPVLPVKVSRKKFYEAKHKWAMAIVHWAVGDISANDIFDGICHDLGFLVEENK